MPTLVALSWAVCFLKKLGIGTIKVELDKTHHPAVGAIGCCLGLFHGSCRRDSEYWMRTVFNFSVEETRNGCRPKR